MLKPPPLPPPSWARRVVTKKRLSAELTDGTGESRQNQQMAQESLKKSTRESLEEPNPSCRESSSVRHVQGLPGLLGQPRA
ncbi:hypothetical protein V498_08425 [Pseudogymnoascus sp. VKM F-4517 (FW-2822)]|nr:hypothetical protein V498_08425 [Pseudogymnoascus sp. VKM F-4517 (FW-2822)]